MAEELVSLDQAKAHTRLTGTAEDEDLQLKLEQAQEVVLTYLSDTTNTTWTATIAAWTDATVPAAVKAAILLQFAYFEKYRGDDPEGKTQDGELAPGVQACLYRLRQPVIA